MKPGTGSVRGDILSAAEQLILEEGLGAATTRAIARAAGCAEGSIYRHFPNKDALVVEVVRTCFPEFFEMLCTLPERAGTGTVIGTLEELASVALDFYRGILPITAGVISDQELLAKNRLAFQQTGHGPEKALDAVATYLAAEQTLGRVSSGVSTSHAARMILGTFFAQAFFEELTGNRGTDNLGKEADDKALVGAVVSVLWRALKPAQTGGGWVLGDL